MFNRVLQTICYENFIICLVKQNDNFNRPIA